MKKSICQSRKQISCYANEIEMRASMQKMKKKKKPKRGRPIWFSEMRSFLIWEKGELGLTGSRIGEKNIKFW